MHLGILPFKSTLAAKHMSSKTRPCTYFTKKKTKQKTDSCVTENFNKTSILQTAMAL